MDAKNWTLNTYSINTWTTLVDAGAVPVIIKSLSVSVGSSNANAKVRIADSAGTSRAVIVPSSTLIALVGYGLDLNALTLNSGDKLQVQANVTGVEFAAFGAA